MYVDERTRINEGVIQHLTSIPPPGDHGKSCHTEPNCSSYTPGSYAAMNYDRVMPVTTASFTRKRMPNTELFGGGFRAQDGGDGLRLNAQAWSEAWTPVDGFAQECDRCVAEIPYNRWDCVQGVPMAYEGSWWHGTDSRQGAQIFTRCDM